MTRVLHVLDHSLPLHSGYTFRTRAILKAQEAMGLEVRGVTGQRHAAQSPSDPEVVDGLTFHRTPGEAGGLPLVREWSEVSALADRIVALAGEWRPDVLHAHSPALCGLAALKAGRTLSLVQTEIFAVTADQERLIAFLTATFMTIENRDGIED